MALPVMHATAVDACITSCGSHLVLDDIHIGDLALILDLGEDLVTRDERERVVLRARVQAEVGLARRAEEDADDEEQHAAGLQTAGRAGAAGEATSASK